MATWDTSMPSNFTDGQVVDEGDLDPIVNNLNFVRYATVFQGGVRRTTAVGSITTTETAVLISPSVTFEAGYLYKIEGMVKWYTNATGTAHIVRVREGSGTAGAEVQSFATPFADATGIGYMVPFNVYVKVTGLVTRPYTCTVVRNAGTGSITVDTTSQMVILRSGDNALMTDV